MQVSAFYNSIQFFQTVTRFPVGPSVADEKSGELAKPEDKTGSKNTRESDTNLQLSPEQQSIVKELAKVDREVRAHEQAHAAVGGVHAGAPSLNYQRGPNGRLYATSGEVPIDTSPVPGDPQATLDKALTVHRAALAPSQPSQTDRRVAAQAAAMAAQARAEIVSSRETETPLGNLLDLQA